MTGDAIEVSRRGWGNIGRDGGGLKGSSANVSPPLVRRGRGNFFRAADRLGLCQSAAVMFHLFFFFLSREEIM